MTTVEFSYFKFNLSKAAFAIATTPLPVASLLVIEPPSEAGLPVTIPGCGEPTKLL